MPLPRKIGTGRALLGGGTPPASSLMTGLISYWTLDEASGSRADSIGGNTLTDNNTVTQNPGKIATAAQFTAATSETLSRANNASLQVGDIDFTIACWVYVDTTVNKDIWVKSSTNQQSYFLTIQSTKFQFIVSAGGTAATYTTLNATTFGNISASTWYHVVAYHDSVNDVIGIAVNGGAANTAATAAGVFAGTGVFALGGVLQYAYMNGRIDEAGFWKKVLTPAERLALYNGGNGITYPFL